MHMRYITYTCIFKDINGDVHDPFENGGGLLH